MKILLNKKVGGAWGFITESFANALKDKNHQVLRYDGNFSTWENFDPDIYIGCSGHQEPIPSLRRAKVAIHANPYGPITIPNINEKDETIKWVLEQSPDAVFGYGTRSDAVFWSSWVSKHNIPWVPMATAGDKTIFSDLGKKRDVDIVYLGGRWQYKALTIDSFLLPVIRDMTASKMLAGWGGWPNDINGFLLRPVSSIDDSEVNDFYNRGKIAPCISEIHTQNYGIDIPERAFKAALCGCLVVHDNVMSIKTLIPSALVAKTPKEYYDLIEYYLHNDEEREALALKQKAEVLQHNTYHNRLSGLLRTLGFVEEASNMES